ncbi:bifunctional metallophosphatase/5'-nucleotidase [Rossellomorea vietnamensis]|uniref:Bifunctional metallophosphatase/5'-nucleotidase n=1 Tax=Rossellomorea vietnamensis TaxID=218284 RepID=A0A5D4M9T2_9BACI|nr:MULTISPECIES: 5'-nucleotidase C-terminal domain-containing protein [Bacillaceae]TYR98177.1 bifunctional metallophosphatase/5'-nucleotidase [Rossellomorea vietnamensis]
MKFKILHTNDLHSHFEQYSRAVSLIRRVQDEHTLLLDAGDFADFKSIELQGTRGIAAIELLESAGYDAITIGNNETFNGVETLQYMASSSSIPFISNNLLRKDKSALDGVATSIIVEKNGIRILVTGSSPDLGEFNDGLGVHISSYKEALLQELHRYEGKYDVSIVLNHVGTFADDDLARELDGIDIIISAHDHQLYPAAKVINGTILNSAGCYGEYVGIIEAEVTTEGVKLIHSETLPTKDEQEDEEVISILKKNKEKAITALSQQLYSLPKPLWHDVVQENPISNLIADGLKDMLNADIGLINSGIVNAGAFGFISNKKLIEICPSPLNPTSFEIQGKYLKEAFEHSLDAQVCLADGRGPGFRGRFVGSLHVSGAEIEHDGTKVNRILIGENPLEEERWYKVASSDYLQRGSGYPELANNRNVKYLPEEIKDVIRLYGKDSSYIESAFINRWKSAAAVTLGR